MAISPVKYHPRGAATTVTPKKKASGVNKFAKPRQVNAPRVRASIVPGAVAVLLAGPYKGKRVVVLKSLASGMVAVTGPFAVNGFPLRRQHPSFLNMTSTRFDISGVNTDKFDDAYFAKEKRNRNTDDFAAKGKNADRKGTLPDSRKKDQEVVDAAIIKAINAKTHADSYMKTRFTLNHAGGLAAHQLKW